MTTIDQMMHDNKLEAETCEILQWALEEMKEQIGKKAIVSVLLYEKDNKICSDGSGKFYKGEFSCGVPEIFRALARRIRRRMCGYYAVYYPTERAIFILMEEGDMQ